MAGDERITQFCVRRLALTPGIQLSERFSEVKEFEVVLVEARNETGAVGYGDALLVPGASPETAEQAWIIACKLAEISVGKSAVEAASLYAPSHLVAPHAVTAMTVAAEMSAGRYDGVSSGAVPLVGVIDRTDPETFDESLEAHGQAGFDTLQLPLTGDVGGDLTALERARQVVAEPVRLRLDGDQAFTPEDALAFAERLDPAGIDWLEQPCVAGDWDAAASVREASAVPLAVSGFIFSADDIETAAAARAADAVLMEFCQFGGLAAFQSALQVAADAGLRVGLGGSFQTDLAAATEAGVIASHPAVVSNLTHAGVAMEPLLADPATTTQATDYRVPGRPRELSDDTISHCTVQELVFAA